MPSTISAATGLPTDYDTDVAILSDQANIVDAFRYYHYGSAYAGTGVVGGIQGHINDIYDYIATVTSSNIVSVGTVTSGTWNAGIITGEYGGTGVANTGKTITIGGNFATVGNYNLTLTLTTATNVTLPSSGTLVNTAVTALSNLSTVGEITAGTWNADVIGEAYGGTGMASFTTGDILVADSSLSLNKLSAVAVGNVLISAGVGTIPVWDKVDIDIHTTGILQPERGGTGNSVLPTDGQVLIGNGISYTLATITEGAGITVLNGAGSITLTNAVEEVLASGDGIGLSTALGITTIDNTGVLSLNGMTGDVDATNVLAAVRARTTEQVTTTLIASGTHWYGFIPLGYSYRIISVETSVPARVRLYDTDAHRYTDSTRPIGTDPVGEHGVMMDMITEPGNLLYTSNPAIDGYNNEDPISVNIPITVTNLDLGSAIVTVTLTYLRTE